MRTLLLVSLITLTLGQTPGPCGPFRNGDITTKLAHEHAELNPSRGSVECSVSDIPEDAGPLNAVVDPDLLWPGGIAYYVMGSEYDASEIALIMDGINDLVNSTKVNGEFCIQIVERSNEQNYIPIGKNGGCSSYVGMIGGRQSMSLDDGCIARHGTIMHEFLHAYGFYHEQSRSDRDDWIWVNYDNIDPGRWNNFRKYDPDEINLLGTPYTYNSVMHYGPYGFAINDSIPTIYTCDPAAMDVIGQRVDLDPVDIERVQLLYNCITPTDSKYFKHLA